MEGNAQPDAFQFLLQSMGELIQSNTQVVQGLAAASQNQQPRPSPLYRPSITPPLFSGKVDFDDPQSTSLSLGQYKLQIGDFMAKVSVGRSLTDKEKILLTADGFIADARSWWEARRPKVEEDGVWLLTYTDFLDELDDRFRDPNHGLFIRTKLGQLVQKPGKTGYSDYVTLFTRLYSELSPGDMTRADTNTYFIKGLLRQTQMKLREQPDALEVELATTIQRAQQFDTARSAVYPSTPGRGNPQAMEIDTFAFRGRGRGRGGRGGGRGGKFTGHCYYAPCGKAGHKQSECNMKKRHEKEAREAAEAAGNSKNAGNAQ